MRYIGAICGFGLAARGFVSIKREVSGPARSVVAQAHYDFIPVEAWGGVSMFVGFMCIVFSLFFKSNRLFAVSMGLCGGIWGALAVSFVAIGSFWVEPGPVYTALAAISVYSAIQGQYD